VRLPLSVSTKTTEQSHKKKEISNEPLSQNENQPKKQLQLKQQYNASRRRISQTNAKFKTKQNKNKPDKPTRQIKRVWAHM
jgi:hypothetical protein